jgi:hypothetical protein
MPIGVLLGKCLPDLPTASHNSSLQQKRLPLARGEKGRRSSPGPGTGLHQPAWLLNNASMSEGGQQDNDAGHVFSQNI